MTQDSSLWSLRVAVGYCATEDGMAAESGRMTAESWAAMSRAIETCCPLALEPETSADSTPTHPLVLMRGTASAPELPTAAAGTICGWSVRQASDVTLSADTGRCPSRASIRSE